MKSKVFPAESKYLDEVKDFIFDEIASFEISPKTEMQLEVVIEEIFVNIVNYSYNPEIGNAEIRCDILDDPPQVVIQFLDSGVPFDPLVKEDADISVEGNLNREGGLGIYIVKQTMDDVDYEYSEGKNILTIKKTLE